MKDDIRIILLIAVVIAVSTTFQQLESVFIAPFFCGIIGIKILLTTKF